MKSEAFHLRRQCAQAVVSKWHSTSHRVLMNANEGSKVVLSVCLSCVGKHVEVVLCIWHMSWLRCARVEDGEL